MKAIYFILFSWLAITSHVLAIESNELILANKFTDFYNKILSDQSAIEKINLLRPKIFIYTDFGGGVNKNKPLGDLQTSGEIAGAAWKGTLQREIYINDSAQPLSPINAAIHLAKSFPYKGISGLYLDQKEMPIHAIVVHVVDPGVGNALDHDHPQPRSMVLRKDGVLFIGPDNGTLSFVCPPDSIANCWEINIDALTLLSGIDTKVGGTFHGRDVFCEAAFRISAGIIAPGEIGIKYTKQDLLNRFSIDKENEKAISETKSLNYERVYTDRLFYDAHVTHESELFATAFLLGIVQSSLYREGQKVAVTDSKKIYLPFPNTLKGVNPFIAIVNYKNGNIFIGPNNGLGSGFFKKFNYPDIKIFHISQEVFRSIINERNNEIVASMIERQPRFEGQLVEIDFLGEVDDLIKDEKNRPAKIKAKIWIDLYGNMKTTIPSWILDEVKRLHASINVIINGVKKSVVLADTFSQVLNGQLFIYNGSSGAIGPNPHRSKRYVEITSNGIYGVFGIDFFENNGIKPQPGDIIWAEFDYPDIH